MSDFFPVLLKLICSPHQNINILNLVLQEFVLELRQLGSHSVNTQTASKGYTVNRIASIEPAYEQNSETCGHTEVQRLLRGSRGEENVRCASCLGPERVASASVPSVWAVCLEEVDIPNSVWRWPCWTLDFSPSFIILWFSSCSFRLIIIRLGGDILVTGCQPKLKTAIPSLKHWVIHKSPNKHQYKADGVFFNSLGWSEKCG